MHPHKPLAKLLRERIAKIQAHATEHRAQLVNGIKLKPATRIPADVPEIEGKQDEDGCDFVEPAFCFVAHGDDDEADDKGEAGEVGQEQTGGRKEETRCYLAAVSVGGVDGIPDGDYAPGDCGDGGYYDDPPAGEEGCEVGGFCLCDAEGSEDGHFGGMAGFCGGWEVGEGFCNGTGGGVLGCGADVHGWEGYVAKVGW